MRITIEHYGKRAEVTLPDDSNLTDVMEVFIGALVACGWSFPVIISWLKEYVENR